MNRATVSNVSNAELLTVRDAMRELDLMVALLERGEREKFILTHRNQMRAVVVSLDRYTELERGVAAAAALAGPGTGGLLRADGAAASRAVLTSLR